MGQPEKLNAWKCHGCGTVAVLMVRVGQSDSEAEDEGFPSNCDLCKECVMKALELFQ